MAIIGRIRKRSGLIVIIVGVALAAFVLGDFLKPGKRYKRSTDIGKVSGENIAYTEFAQKVEEQLESIKQRGQKEKLTADEVFSAKQSTWTQLINELIMGKQYEELGLTVSTDELYDLVQGKNPHRYILQYFTDPKTKQYNPALVQNFLKQLDQVPADQKKNWLMLEKAIKEERIQTKYNNLLAKGYYLPKTFAQNDHIERNRRFNVRVVGTKYQTIDDKAVTLTEDDYKKYYEENKYLFEQEASRDIAYVLFEIKPSATDLDKIAKDVAQLFQEFQKSADVPAYVNANSDSKFDSTFHKEKTLPARIDSLLFNSTVGTIIPPYIENNAYHMAKLLDMQYRPDSMKASHILVTFKGSAVNDQKITRSKDRAKIMADSLFTIIKKDGNRFRDIAANVSDDKSVKEKGGDLGWFADGAMIKPFNDAVLEGKIGEMKVVETPFGYHIILITDKKTPEKKVKVAVLDRRIEPSSQTYQDIYAKASEFAGENTSLDAFSRACDAKKLNPRMAERVKDMDNSLPGINQSRNVIMWAYNEETKKGTVSTVFETEGNYVVAALKEIREKGIAPLEQIKNQIQPLVLRDKKAEKIIENIKKLNTKDLYQLAEKLTGKVDTLANVMFANINLQLFGPEPEVVGTIATMKQGGVTEPIKGNQAVYVVQLDSIAEPPVQKDFTIYNRQAAYMFGSRVQREAFPALEKLAGVIDNRAMFY
jgi:peptidyl-prolyl cis-trans isomerase D